MRSDPMKALSLALLCVALTGCASTGRLLSYGTNNAQAQIDIGNGRKMNVWSHPTDPSLLIVQTVGSAAGQGAVEGATFGMAEYNRPDVRNVDAAVSRFLAPVGCSAQPAQQLGTGAIQFEAFFQCPADVNLRQLMFAQKEGLMRGEPLRR
jgi:hypothetical protein